MSEVERLFMDKSLFNTRASSESLGLRYNDELEEDSRHVCSGVEYCNNSFNDSFTLPVVPDVLVERVFSGYY